MKVHAGRRRQYRGLAAFALCLPVAIGLGVAESLIVFGTPLPAMEPRAGLAYIVAHVLAAALFARWWLGSSRRAADERVATGSASTLGFATGLFSIVAFCVLFCFMDGPHDEFSDRLCFLMLVIPVGLALAGVPVTLCWLPAGRCLARVLDGILGESRKRYFPPTQALSLRLTYLLLLLVPALVGPLFLVCIRLPVMRLLAPFATAWD